MRWLIILLLISGCSGYRFTQQDNPLSQYGIQSLSVPMFYNYSNIADIQTDFTRETYRLLMNFGGLKLVNGYNKNSDAVMIGILKSPEKLAETIRAMSPRVAQNQAKKAIGPKRQNFYVPGISDVQVFLQIIVIKKPTEEELALLKSGIGDQIQSNSKIIFNEHIPLRVQYVREILDEAGVQVVATQNAGVQRKSLKNLAEQAAENVRDMILYAF
jgi:hypothetical protein